MNEEGLKQEKELLLLQLHQLQEELDHYYLKYTTLKESVRSGKGVIADSVQPGADARSGASAVLLSKLVRTNPPSPSSASLADIISNSSEFRALSERTRSLQDELTAERRRVNELRDQSARLASENETLTGELDALRKQGETQLATKIGSLTEEKESLEVRTTGLEREVVRLNEEYESARAALVGQNRVLEEQLERYDKEIAAQKWLIDTLNHQLESRPEGQAKEGLELVERGAQLVSENKELSTRNANLEKTIQELDYRQSLLDSEICRVEGQLRLMEDIILREKAF